MTRVQRVRQLLQFDQKLRRRQRLNAGALAGVDEAGRGPLAGPVVASAVVLLQIPNCSFLDDSKRLTPRARETAYRAILPSAAIGIGAAGAEEIDRIGIHAATHLAMVRALRKLPFLPDLALVDGIHVPPGCPVPAAAVVHGDARSLSIACASIVAKVVRDQWMGLVHRLHPEYGFLQHKGYGTEEHVKALRWLGPCRFHRFSFAPVRDPAPPELREKNRPRLWRSDPVLRSHSSGGAG